MCRIAHKYGRMRGWGVTDRQERIRRLTDDDGHIFMVPMDHGLTLGPVLGVTDITKTLDKVADLATCTTVHKGLIPKAREFQDRMGIIMHLSASTVYAPDPDDKRIVGTVREAVSLGADAVSVHLNLGSRTEADQIEAIGRVSTECQDLDVPLIAMVYPRGPTIMDSFNADLVAHAARLGAELGADIVKVPYPGDQGSFRAVVRGAGVPVVVAGGPKSDHKDRFLQTIQGAADAKAAGFSVGRNVFQADNPAQVMKDLIRCFSK